MITAIEQHILNHLKTNKDNLFRGKGIDDVFLEAGNTSSILKDNKPNSNLIVF